MLLNALIPLSILKICINIVLYKFFRRKKRLRLIIIIGFLVFTLNIFLAKYFLMHFNTYSDGTEISQTDLLPLKQSIDTILHTSQPVGLQSSPPLLPQSLVEKHISAKDAASIYFLNFLNSKELDTSKSHQNLKDKKSSIENFYWYYLAKPFEDPQINFAKRMLVYQLRLSNISKLSSNQGPNKLLKAFKSPMLENRFNLISKKIGKLLGNRMDNTGSRPTIIKSQLEDMAQLDQEFEGYGRKNMEEYQSLRLRYIQVLNNSSTMFKVDAKRLWDTASNWVSQSKVNPDYAPEMVQILSAMRTLPYGRADIVKKGTQLKVQLTLVSGATLIMKPQRYARTQEFPDYQGADRHNGEIVSFHINWLLGLNRAPITTGRLVNLTELQLKSTRPLRQTFYMKDDGHRCFYGVCMYCNKEDTSVCTKGNELLETSVSLLLPPDVKLKKVVNPWIRSYRDGYLSWWEHEPSFCEIVKVSRHPTNHFSERTHLLDLIDASIFDFLTGNSDRHHVELLSRPSQRPTDRPFVLLLDNGKSFGTPKTDELSILAPLYGCCHIRASTWERLLVLASLPHTSHSSTNASLAALLKEILRVSEPAILDLLIEPYYTALNRRLGIVMATVYHCLTYKAVNETQLLDRYRSVIIKDEL